MTELVIHLPDDLEERARTAGLLSDRAIQALLEDAMLRQGRAPPTDRDRSHPRRRNSPNVDARDRR